MAQRVFQFGEFRLDLQRFSLTRGGRALRLERKPMELLILLADRNGDLVTREEIARRLWGTEVFVDTEHGINTAIRKVRQVLGDDSDEPLFVQTVSGRGYRFVAPVTMTPPPVPAAAVLAAAPAAPPTRPSPRSHRLHWMLSLAGCGLLALIAGIAYRSGRQPEVQYTQLTDYTDSAVAPAISPDGRLLAFIRGGEAFLSADPIYIKTLPDGEARPVTNDQRLKYSLGFSPDSSEITYTVLAPPFFDTYAVSVFGGDPRLFMRNAAAISWLDPQRLLFSRILSGIHLGVVTGTATGDNLHEIYYPAHARGMAHASYASPDRRWILVVEMNEYGGWAPCRLVSLTGNGASRTVGPSGACTAAAWSPDGSWMYFTATVNRESHVWRQRFPGGRPQQLTFGASEEDGLAVEDSGHSLITSVGTRESALWLHDDRGERPISSEGVVVSDSSPCFRESDRLLYYLLRRKTRDSGAELWRFAVQSGKSEAVFPGLSLLNFDISPDGMQAIFTTAGKDGQSDLWIAPVDRSAPPARLAIRNAVRPYFGRNGGILFQRAEGNANYLEEARRDGSGRSKVVPYPIVEITGVSPGRRWAMVMTAELPDRKLGPVALPLDGGSAIRICSGYCVPGWSSNGRFLLVDVDPGSEKAPGRSLAIPAGPDEALPLLPSEGIAPGADPDIVPGAQSLPRADLIMGSDPLHYAFVNTATHRNLYRVSWR